MFDDLFKLKMVVVSPLVPKISKNQWNWSDLKIVQKAQKIAMIKFKLWQHNAILDINLERIDLQGRSWSQND